MADPIQLLLLNSSPDSNYDSPADVIYWSTVIARQGRDTLPRWILSFRYYACHSIVSHNTNTQTVFTQLLLLICRQLKLYSYL